MKFVLVGFLLALGLSAQTQEKEKFFVFDLEWNPTKIDSAVYFMHMHQVNDTCYQWDYYNLFGPMIRSERYRDADGKELDGVSNFYTHGYLDSTVVYHNGLKKGKTSL